MCEEGLANNEIKNRDGDLAGRRTLFPEQVFSADKKGGGRRRECGKKAPREKAWRGSQGWKNQRIWFNALERACTGW